jgi:twitching motility protein PilT
MALTSSHDREAVSLLNGLFALCEGAAASDIHLCAGLAPRLRIHGILSPLPGSSPLDARLAESCGLHLVLSTFSPNETDPVARARALLLSNGSIDGAVTSPAGHRYRFNVFRESGSTAIAMRRLDDRFLSLEELGLPPRLADFCGLPDGLVVVSGPTGAGKSTTLATLIEQINLTRDGHIITIEDPVEYVHASDRCLVHQRQIGRDATSCNNALV